MINYTNELEALKLWRFHCIKKAERLNKYSTIGIGISDREAAEIEINKEYYKRLDLLKQQHGIKTQITAVQPTEQFFDRLVI